MGIGTDPRVNHRDHRVCPKYGTCTHNNNSRVRKDIRSINTRSSLSIWTFATRRYGAHGRKNKVISYRSRLFCTGILNLH